MMTKVSIKEQKASQGANAWALGRVVNLYGGTLVIKERLLSSDKMFVFPKKQTQLCT